MSEREIPRAHTRTSYRAEEVAWNARFVSVFIEEDGAGHRGIDVGRLDEIEPVEEIGLELAP